VRVGDFVQFDGNYYEIIQTSEPKLLWGQADRKFEITAIIYSDSSEITCIPPLIKLQTR
jgi:hypothetical protein